MNIQREFGAPPELGHLQPLRHGLLSPSRDEGFRRAVASILAVYIGLGQLPGSAGIALAHFRGLSGRLSSEAHYTGYCGFRGFGRRRFARQPSSMAPPR